MRYKYPRTFHLPWSEGRTSDDKVLKNTNHFTNRNVVFTEKRDGENTTLYCDHYHARSIDSKDHESRHWIKQFWSSFKHEIPEGMRICGENLYAKHSIGYDDLDTYFEVFSIWIDDICLSWEATKEWCSLLGLKHVPVLWEGRYCDEMWNYLPKCALQYKIATENMEGYVIRVAEEFHFGEFKWSVAKWVRKNHVQTDTHWMHQTVVPNKLRSMNEGNN